MAVCLVTISYLAVVFSQNNYVGPIIIKEDGQDMTRYVMSGNAKNIQILNNSTISLNHNNGFQIAKTQSTTYGPYIWQEYKLVNKTLSFTADLSEIDCSCNAAFFLVSMPGYDSSGQPEKGQAGSYYCGANLGNKGKGAYCMLPGNNT